MFTAIRRALSLTAAVPSLTTPANAWGWRGGLGWGGVGLGLAAGALIGTAPVVCGLLLVTIAMLGMQSIRVLGSMPQTNANLFAAGTGIVIGIGITALPQDFVSMMPSLFRPFVSSGIIMSFLVAGSLHVVFNLILKTSENEASQIPM